jgi:chitin synthase
LQKEKDDSDKLKNLRNIAVFAFFMVNALFVLVIFLLQLSRDVIHIKWPLGVKVQCTVLDNNNDVRILNTN